jgi:hypothetical protein
MFPFFCVVFFFVDNVGNGDRDGGKYLNNVLHVKESSTRHFTFYLMVGIMPLSEPCLKFCRRHFVSLGVKVSVGRSTNHMVDG